MSLIINFVQEQSPIGIHWIIWYGLTASYMKHTKHHHSIAQNSNRSLLPFSHRATFLAKILPYIMQK